MHANRGSSKHLQRDETGTLGEYIRLAQLVAAPLCQIFVKLRKVKVPLEKELGHRRIAHKLGSNWCCHFTRENLDVFRINFNFPHKYILVWRLALPHISITINSGNYAASRKCKSNVSK